MFFSSQRRNCHEMRGKKCRIIILFVYLESTLALHLFPAAEEIMAVSDVCCCCCHSRPVCLPTNNAVALGVSQEMNFFLFLSVLLQLSLRSILYVSNPSWSPDCFKEPHSLYLILVHLCAHRALTLIAELVIIRVMQWFIYLSNRRSVWCSMIIYWF